MHVGQAKIAAGVTIGERFVIEAEEVEDRGVEVVDMHPFLDRAEAELVGRSVDVSAFHPSARHPHRKAVMIVVAAVDFARVGAWGG